MRHLEIPPILAAFVLATINGATLNCDAVETAPLDDCGVLIDDRTPEAAIRSFYNALAKGDAVLARKLLVSPKKMAKWTEIQANMSVSFKRLGAAAVSQFGEGGKTLQVPVPAETLPQKLETVKPVQDGDTAEWPVNPKVPMKMKRIDGRWKLDLYSSFKTPAHLRQINDVHGRVATYVGKIATDIAEGRLKSVADVREEMKRQRQAMNKEFAK